MNKPIVQSLEGSLERPRPRRAPPLWFLALLTLSGTLAMHIFAPALPRAARDLGVGASVMGLTVSLYIVGLAFGQLIYGPLSDRFGRRPALMSGLALYTLAGLVAAAAPNVAILIVARLFQALGGCAGLALARAMVRDTAPLNAAARRLALLNLMVTLGPGLAPILGGAMIATTGWRSILILLCAIGACLFIMAWRLLPETASTLEGVNAARLAADYRGLLRSSAFLGFAIGGGCATTSMYGFIAAAPFIFIEQLGRPPYEVGFSLAVAVVGVWLGSALASRLISRVALPRLLIAANLVSVAAAFALLAVVLVGPFTVAALVTSMFFFTLGAGLAAPLALSEAISVNPRVIGSASGLYGFTQMAIGALCAALAGLGSNPALAAAIVLVGAGVIAQVSFWIALGSRKAPAGREAQRSTEL
jgi:DHA1 family bicyclomycin/chloramphenicol resistance-like MFS transporter